MKGQPGNLRMEMRHLRCGWQRTYKPTLPPLKEAKKPSDRTGYDAENVGNVKLWSRKSAWFLTLRVSGCLGVWGEMKESTEAA